MFEEKIHAYDKILNLESKFDGAKDLMEENFNKSEIQSLLFIYIKVYYGIFLVNSMFIFYRLVPALLRQSAYGTIKIGVYYTLKGIIVPNPDGKLYQLL